MRQFFKRVDRLVDLMVDTASLMGPKARLRPIPIKTIFDNLRLYAALGLLWLGVKVLQADHALWAPTAEVALGTVTVVLAFLVFLQTSLIALAAAFGVAAALLHPRVAVKFRRGIRSNSRLLWIPIVVLTFLVMSMAVLIAAALASALIRSGSI